MIIETQRVQDAEAIQKWLKGQQRLYTLRYCPPGKSGNPAIKGALYSLEFAEKDVAAAFEQIRDHLHTYKHVKQTGMKLTFKY